MKIARIFAFLAFFFAFSAIAAPPDLSAMGALHHPILLVHGATAGGSKLIVGPFRFGEYFLGIPDYLRKSKTKVYVVDLPPDASIEECATILKVFLRNNLPDEKVNIIGHSQGGLDARYLATVLKSPQVASITSIATPHRGSPLANWCMNQVNGRTLWNHLFRLLGYNLKARHFLPELTTEFMKEKFNPLVPDRQDVRYYSVVATGKMGTRTLSPLLYFPYWWLRSIGGPISLEANDGFVPESSQAWGVVLEHADLDHLAEIGHDTLRFYSLRDESLALYGRIYARLLKDGL